MWASLRSDFREFVSSVADDSSKVLKTIDQKILEAESGTKLNRLNEGSDDESDQNDQIIISTDGELAYLGSGYESTGVISDAMDEVARRMSLEETFLNPLLQNEINDPSYIDDKDVEEVSGEMEGSEPDYFPHEQDVRVFLASFDIVSKTDEISVLLKQYPILEEQFNNLVPIVISYEQFWQRYFYRCDPERIQREWDEEEERVRQERREIIEKGVNNVKSLWGGALKALHSVAGSVDAAKGGKNEQTDQTNISSRANNIYEKYQAQIEEEQRALLEGSGNSTSSNYGFFGSGRPPFVLNTADSGDEDVGEYKAHKSHNEEEDDEIGWGSDDDDDIEVEDTTDESAAEPSEQEITFESPERINVLEVQSLRDSLSQALIDRERLAKLVEEQKDEISRLRSESSVTEHNGSRDEIDRLNMAVFERDAELAAFKASLEETCEVEELNKKLEDKLNAQTRTIEALSADIEVKEKELEKFRDDRLKALLDNDKIQIILQTTTRELEDARTLIRNLESELHSTKAHAEQRVNEYDILYKQSSLELDRFRALKAEDDATIATLLSSLDETRVRESVSKDRIIALEDNLKLFTSQLESSSELARRNEINSLKVASPQSQESPIVVDDDDWGESWGDDDQ